MLVDCWHHLKFINTFKFGITNCLFQQFTNHGNNVKSKIINHNNKYGSSEYCNVVSKRRNEKSI